MQQYSGLLQFRVDPLLSTDLRKALDSVLSPLKESEKFDSLAAEKSKNKLTVDFVSEGSLHLLRPGEELRICLLDNNQGLFSFGQNIDESLANAVLDDTIDLRQLERVVYPFLKKLIHSREEEFTTLGLKNLRKFESKVKQVIAKKADDAFTSESLLNYFQSLVDLEKDLIQADELYKLEKVLKQFAKNNIEKSKFQFLSASDLASISPSDNFLLLPPFKGEFIAIEMHWQEEDTFRLIKRLFFFYTLVNFFKSQHDIEDPFFDESLWEEVLDAIPFPVALLSQNGEVHQHNTLFAKLGFTPGNCLKLKLREKILINDIPYNVYRKDVHHADHEKILFVFFTESFFLKGDGNLTPTGQELGIISSSIAHELNNPIAGIQAALSLLLLDEELNQEAQQTLKEMKNGAMRCKQLIETFLGFSRANPKNLAASENALSTIDICYQQAQNLLRFRTVESGIRFHFTSSKHADFRAQVNPSLLTMTFYLILGELMTLYSHQLLVANKNQIEKVIKGEIIESSQEIQIQLHELNISTLSLSKLIQNLLNIENFVLQVSDYSLRFIYNP
ncbi:MAG: histidine kinase dimerization/phospho-acceptor domain-containing protein [Bacteriovoracia bacterium]